MVPSDLRRPYDGVATGNFFVELASLVLYPPWTTRPAKRDRQTDFPKTASCIPEQAFSQFKTFHIGTTPPPICTWRMSKPISPISLQTKASIRLLINLNIRDAKPSKLSYPTKGGTAICDPWSASTLEVFHHHPKEFWLPIRRVAHLDRLLPRRRPAQVQAVDLSPAAKIQRYAQKTMWGWNNMFRKPQRAPKF